MNYLLFNPFADNGASEENAKNLTDLPAEFKDVKLISTKDLNYKDFLKTLKTEDKVILFGGDGTINYFVNQIYGEALPCQFFLHRAGTGNDFATDNEDAFNGSLLPLNKYLENLPLVELKDNKKKARFVNGIGFGIDGLACVEADRMKAAGAKKIDYTSITIKLLLLKYRRPNAIVNVDGKEYKFKKVYLASAMKGRYYGGGMKVAPEQDRNSDHLTITIISGKSRLGTLMGFPAIFKGEHVKNSMTTILTGKKITVTYSIPSALQIDGEAYDGITSYTAYAKK